MTAVPKPLKFLRPHYDDMAKLYEEWPPGEDKVGYKLVGCQEITVLNTLLELSCRRTLCPRNDIR